MNFKKKIFGIMAAGILLVPSIINTIHPFIINAKTDAKEKYESDAETSKQKVTVNLHKIEATQEEFENTPYQNTGDIMANLETKNKIAGVKFKGYEVTSYFETKVKEISGKSDVLAATQEQRLAAYQATVNHFKNMPANEINNEYGPGLTTNPVITGETNGIATFADIRPAQSDGRNRVYVFVETDTSNAHYINGGGPVQIVRSANTVLALPIIKDNNEDGLYTANEADSVIDIYPKNVIDSRPEIAKKLIPTAQDKADDSDGNQDGFISIDDLDATNGPLGTTGNTSDPTVTRSIGELVDFEIEYKLPHDLASLVNETKYKHANFTLNDLPDIGLNFFSIKELSIEDITGKLESFPNDKSSYSQILGTPLDLTINKYSNVAGSNAASNYATTRNLQFKFDMPTTVNAENTAKLQALAGKLIKIKLKMIVSSDAPIEESMNNLIKYKNHKNDDSDDNKGEDDSEFVIVFKPRFIKVDGRSDNPITDGKAGFVLKNNKGYYFGGYKEDGRVIWLEIAGNPKASDFAKGNVKGTIHVEEGSYEPPAPSGEGNVKVFWTTQDGTSENTITTGEVNLPGLRKGSYEVVEVQAPEGYYLDNSATTISFTIEGAVGQNTVEKIKNYPQGYLPSTGGIGIVIFLVIGISAMGIGGYMLIRNRKVKGNIS
ncbi:MAG: LPXTG cell wall anchor domain-containing protein [Streptococcaceae bacterium]|jgi:LPXTG-motif cell wall-anchored protein|nr:LPXTG cell wall anchor domain-containing protein [Streptococcaceae bacterium]